MIAAWQRTTHRLLAALDAELADLRLTPGEVNALAALAGGPQTARALADATAQRPSTLTGVVDRLERRGLVARRPNPADRRSLLIAPTAPDVVARVAAAFAAIEARIADPASVRTALAEIDAAVGAGEHQRSLRPPRRRSPRPRPAKATAPPPRRSPRSSPAATTPGSG